jgi:Yip1 domain
MVLGGSKINADDAAARTWLRIWLAAVTKPTVATYQELARHPQVGSMDAWMWLLGSSLLSGLFISLGSVQARTGAVAMDSSLALAIAIFALMAVLSWASFTACIQGIARLMKGGGNYQSLIFVFAAFNAPLMVLTSGLSLVPRGGAILMVLYLYWLALYSVAVRAAHQFSWMKAAGAVLFSLAALSGALFGLVILVFSLRL